MHRQEYPAIKMTKVPKIMRSLIIRFLGKPKIGLSQKGIDREDGHSGRSSNLKSFEFEPLLQSCNSHFELSWLDHGFVIGANKRKIVLP